MSSMKKRCLWVFGNAVQDITVEVDTQRLAWELDDKRDLIRLTEQGPQIKRNLWLKTQIGSQQFGVEVDLAGLNASQDGSYTLVGGEKYNLLGRITDSHDGIGEPFLFLPCENLSWGGGGANVVTFLRALTPSSEIVPIRYTDIATDVSLSAVITKIRQALGRLGQRLPALRGKDRDVLADLESLLAVDSVRGEATSREVAAIAADYSPERSLTVYLASLSVESVLHRPPKPRPRRNWVFSRFRSAYRELSNKIILKGSFDPLQIEEQGNVEKLLEAHACDVGAILINSLKDRPLFEAAFGLCKRACKEEDFVAMLAMTETTQVFTSWMLEQRNSEGFLPPFILVLNETEAHRLAVDIARVVGAGGVFRDEQQFMRDGGPPNIRLFAGLAQIIRKCFSTAGMPRIYVTLGDRGSLGVDGGGHVVYVASFSKRGATVYDTNACGDAYCATIALLEWAKRHGYPNLVGPVDLDTDPGAQEMQYFMAVATAAAYCKATNRRGRVYAAELVDLLQYNHLASEILWPLDALINLSKVKRRPECIDENFHLREPAIARYVGVTDDLRSLIS